MADRIVKWLDFGYKGAVLIGSVSIVWAHSTFASKGDISKIVTSIHQIEIQLTRIDLGLSSQTSERGHLSDEVKAIRERQREIEARLRVVELK